MSFFDSHVQNSEKYYFSHFFLFLRGGGESIADSADELWQNKAEENRQTKASRNSRLQIRIR